MQRFQLSLLLGACAYACALLTGCGESGSHPVVYAEVRFFVQPVGPTSFAVDFLSVGGTCHKFPANQTFTVTAPVSFFIENSPSPYVGQFRRTGAANIAVALRVTGQTVSSGTTGTSDTVTVVAGQPTPVPTDCTPNANPEVRFDVCAPSPGTSTCFPTRGTCSNASSQTCQVDGDCPSGGTCAFTSGIPGFQFTGSLGDSFISHLLSQPSAQDPPLTTPAMYFLEGARDTVNAVFRGQTNSQPLLVQLFINGQLRQTQSGTGDVIIREDI